MKVIGSRSIGGFNQRQGQALPPQIFLTLSRSVFTVQMRKIGSVYSQENCRNCCHLMSDFKAKKAPNSISAEALYAPHPAIGELTCCSQTPTDPILAFGPPGLETTCLPKYVSLNPPMHATEPPHLKYIRNLIPRLSS